MIQNMSKPRKVSRLRSRSSWGAVAAFGGVADVMGIADDCENSNPASSARTEPWRQVLSLRRDVAPSSEDTGGDGQCEEVERRLIRLRSGLVFVRKRIIFL